MIVASISVALGYVIAALIASVPASIAAVGVWRSKQQIGSTPGDQTLASMLSDVVSRQGATEAWQESHASVDLQSFNDLTTQAERIHAKQELFEEYVHQRMHDITSTLTRVAIPMDTMIELMHRVDALIDKEER